MVARRHPRRTFPLRGALIFTLLLALAGLIASLTSQYFRVAEVRVPDVVGADLETASRDLRALGFEVTRFTKEEAAAPPGSVTSQSPEAGSVVRRGRGVSLGVNAPPSGAAVPNLVGRPQEEVAARLEGTEVQLSRVRYRYSPRSAGQVLAQTPPAGTEITGRTNLSLVVSRGPQPRRVALPRVVGARLDVAQERLAALGFRRIEAVPTRLGRPGVNAQVPAAGTRTPVSAPVTLYYTVGNQQVVRVPEVSGLPLSRVVPMLRAAGLRVGWVEAEPFDPNKPRGVTQVSPQDYTLWGTSVEIHTNGAADAPASAWQQGEPVPPLPGVPRVGGTPQPGQQGRLGESTRGGGAQGLTADSRQIPINFDPASYTYIRDRPYEFRIEVTDARGDRVVLNRAMGSNEPVRDTVTVYGEAELRMYIDGQIALAYNP